MGGGGGGGLTAFQGVQLIMPTQQQWWRKKTGVSAPESASEFNKSAINLSISWEQKEIKGVG